MEKIKIRLTLTEDLLGTASGNKELYADYIATKAPTADMVEQEIDDFNPELAMEKAISLRSVSLASSILPAPSKRPTTMDTEEPSAIKVMLNRLIMVLEIFIPATTPRPRTE